MKPTAPTHLRVLRQARGFTQERLARQASIGVRTLRALESGETDRPHPDSLLRIGRALGLSAEQCDGLLTTWSPSGGQPLAPIVGESLDVDVYLGDGRSRITNGQVRTVLGINHMQIGADRRPRSCAQMRLFEARQDEVSGYWLLWGHEPGQDLEKVSLTIAAGGSVLERTLLPDTDVVAFKVGFPQPLARYQRHYMHAVWDFVDCYPSAGALTSRAGSEEEPSTEYLCGWNRSPEHQVVAVTFEGEAPGRLWEMKGEEPTSFERVRAAAVDASSTVTASFSSPAPGMRGFSWEW
jgi:transcriptional regulator with XRE-family HTH domain